MTVPVTLLNLPQVFDLVSDYAPAGDQPQAIAKLMEGILSGAKHQVLLRQDQYIRRLTVNLLDYQAAFWQNPADGIKCRSGSRPPSGA